MWGAGILDARALIQAELPELDVVEAYEEERRQEPTGVNPFRDLLGPGAWVDLNNPFVLAVLGTPSFVAGALADAWQEWTDPDGAVAGAVSTNGFLSNTAKLIPALDATAVAEAAAETWERTLATALSVGGEVGDWVEEQAQEAQQAWGAAEDQVDEALDEAEDAVDEFVESTGEFIERGRDGLGEEHGDRREDRRRSAGALRVALDRRAAGRDNLALLGRQTWRPERAERTTSMIG